MLKDLDDSLKELLMDQLPRPVVDTVTISFSPPDELRGGQMESLPAINLFLYDICECRELRNCEPNIERTRREGDKSFFTISKPLVRIDCSYLITAWQNPGTIKAVDDEHYLLGVVMRVLLRHPVLPKEVQIPSMVLQCTSLMPSPSSSRAYSRRE
ncbi:hypothetical protein CCP3SC15_6110002 [Gammaproteobacteria bacterium]